MQEGRVMQIDSPQGVVRSYRNTLIAVKSSDMYKLLFEVQEYPRTIRAYRSGEFIHIEVKEEKGMMESLNEFLEKREHKNIVVKKMLPTVEDCFMALMK
jgi:ribosome-associated toxin RatA of RatAB toxin-antitoxin module